MKALVIIPTYNERDNIEDIATQVLQQDERLEILVVDDNSPDGTADLVKSMMKEEPRIHILERPGKLGLGTAYCAGFKYGIEQHYDVVFEMDADFSHDPKELPAFLEAIQVNDMIIGSRYSNGVNVVNWPMSRLLLSYFANVYTRIITGIPVHDATGGFACIRVSALKKIDLTAIKSNGYAFQIEIKFKIWKTGGKLKELPIIFIDRRSGVSKMSRKIVYEAVFLVWKLKFMSLFGSIR